jgi:hypothetical protein
MTRLELLRAAVAAKIAYWDALGELETNLFGDHDHDAGMDAVEDDISDLAAGGEPHQIEQYHVDEMAKIPGVNDEHQGT